MRDLITKLLEKDPTKRLGYNGADEIQKHPAFANIKWDEELMIKKTPPFVPILTKPNDLRYFDKVRNFLSLEILIFFLLEFLEGNSSRNTISQLKSL